MTWEQKLQALIALTGGLSSNMAVAMRHPGDWYVVLGGLWLAKACTLESYTVSAPTPQSAVERTWKRLVEDLHQEDEALAVDAPGSPGSYRYYRWNGFMWREVERPSASRAPKEAKP